MRFLRIELLRKILAWFSELSHSERLTRNHYTLNRAERITLIILFFMLVFDWYY